MNKNELFSFIKEFNNSGAISNDVILEAMNHLSDKDIELFMLLVNYKNGKDFAQKLKNGVI